MAFNGDLTGSILDRRYRITGLLGKGGMGHVYEAVHIALDQRVAVKVLHPRYAYEERFRERFLQEARAASKIRHPNVVEIKDFGETPDGSVYFVMEYLHGHDVGDELKRHGSLPWARTRSILLQAASALHAAHAKHIIHRDIKPANCFLIEDETEGLVDRVKLLDFGIAKVGSDSHADAQGKGLTGTGEVFGTASYMSPEQARGETLDARSDMYSLGIMAYEMLVGQVPFTGVNAIHVIAQHLTARPEPLRSHDGTIPPVLDALVLKMMARERDDRYASMAEVEAELREIPEDLRARKTRQWSSPGDLRALVAEKKAASGALLPPGVDPDRTEKVAPKKVAGLGGVGLGGVKRTVVSVDRAPAVPMPEREPEPVLPVPASVDAAPPAPSLVAPVVAAPFGAPMAPVASPQHGMQAPMQAPMGWVAPGRADGTNPPPGAEDMSASPSTWPPSTVSTGPYARHGDTGTETHPHTFQPAQRSGITGRMLLVVGLLVVLVGGGSAVGTMVFLSKQDEAQSEAEPSVVEPAAAKPEASPVPEPAKAVEPEKAVEPAKVEPAKAEPELQMQPEEVVVPELDASPDIDGDTKAVDEPAADGGDVEVEPVPTEGEAERRSADEPRGSQPPRASKRDPEKCAKVREAAHAALGQRRWTEALQLAKQRECWPSASERRHVQVNALLESGRFGECVSVGNKATDQATVKMVEICRKRVSK